MRLLLTNDDGIDAPGLRALELVARRFAEIVVVAPDGPLSGCSHRVTTHHPLRLRSQEPGRYSLDGTPADCVRVALRSLLDRVDGVLAGINAGGNLGADTYLSGTVAAVREAALLGIPGIALSQYMRRGVPVDWEMGSDWLHELLPELLRTPAREGDHWNVNLPHLDPGSPTPEVVRCPLDISPMPVSFHVEGEYLVYNGNYHERPRKAGTDVSVCFGGKIAVTRLVLGSCACQEG